MVEGTERYGYSLPCYPLSVMLDSFVFDVGMAWPAKLMDQRYCISRDYSLHLGFKVPHPPSLPTSVPPSLPLSLSLFPRLPPLPPSPTGNAQRCQVMLRTHPSCLTQVARGCEMVVTANGQDAISLEVTSHNLKPKKIPHIIMVTDDKSKVDILLQGDSSLWCKLLIDMVVRKCLTTVLEM